MNISIRKFLLINLLAAILITTMLTVAANYFLDKKDVQAHMDDLLILSAQWYRALLADDYEPQNLANVQKHLNKVPEYLNRYMTKQVANSIHKQFIDEIPFQIWSTKNTLLLYSPGAPKASLLGDREGFSDKEIDGHMWRVFSIYLPDGAKLAVANKDTASIDLVAELTKDDLYIMIFSLPLSALLIWFIIGKGLSGLNRITKQITERAPTHLEPVNIEKIPTEIKPVINAINHLFVRLQQAFDREKRFAADAAHELRTPLAALKTQAQVALKTQDGKERNVALRNLIQGVNRSTHIVQQLLTLSRLVPEDTPITEYEDVKLTKLAAEIIAQIAPAAIEKQIDIALDCKNEEVTIPGNYTALSILIRNLVDNAVRYTPNNGQVTIRIIDDIRRVILIVSDTGPGIPVALRARVFERFFRVLGNKSPGSGLGLAIVQQIANLHYATVHLSSPAEGSGLIVEVIFPKERQ